MDIDEREHGPTQTETTNMDTATIGGIPEPIAANREKSIETELAAYMQQNESVQTSNN